MEKDFHYNITYIAALDAGYTIDEAKIIAFSAQYVDRCSNGIPSEYCLTDRGKNFIFTKLETIHDPIAKTLFQGFNTDVFKRVWYPFHFLPGNYDLLNKHKNTMHILRTIPPRSNLGDLPLLIKDNSFLHDNNHIRRFPCICRPYSHLAQEMIEDTKNFKKNNKNKRNWDNIAFLMLIGIRMHVLADTWAHQDFVGTPDSVINTFSGEVEYEYYGDDSKKMKFSYFQNNKYDSENEIKKLIQTQCVPNIGIKNDSTSVLGHGSMGILPDLPGAFFKYKPNWSNYNSKNNIVTEPVTRNNRKEFMEAYHNLVTAMKYIKSESTPPFKWENKFKDTKYSNIILTFLCDPIAGAGVSERVKYLVSKFKEYSKIDFKSNDNFCDFDSLKNNLMPCPDRFGTYNAMEFIQSTFFKFNIMALYHYDFIKKTFANHINNMIPLKFKYDLFQRPTPIKHKYKKFIDDWFE